MKLVQSLSFILSLLPATLAEVQFTVPAFGTSFKSGDVVTAHWKELGTSPRISELTHYDLYLYAGGETADTQMEIASLIRDGMFARGNSVSFKIDPHFGGSQTNAYFLKMVSFGPEAFAINFSERFTLNNMTGSFPPQLVEDIRSLPDSEDYPVKEDLRKRVIQTAHTVPYALQTGPTRYAPMAKKPGSTIPAKAKTPTPQFSASLYTIATTWLPVATVHMTLSTSMTFSVVSIENTASPAPHPHDMAARKLLERWKD
ncbi:putative beta-1,6-glucan biosynthesis protein (Knh1) [Aspergillus clavatus NRRL 1]|uniref:Beta-1,6-glucan boisynthesis protein (Knh1), putative n=1 Tax=Aspergillus clavatus (strain ATCC 1007 / CBS 513.65 / DSM 816 / NCTC 3887 / NRRL 1 / QM 1276 / 107) TaxID=344612 RepID=A1CSI8_ASPCL|nr:beta-1,6-glucan boisynthesis protein (Knh1), putative [Aspergillus clavatus NRRL 1]EAW06275.1 beta-1,6-glucan boisynthesis protein (Knh1), putative [Aspergillus clavatus NRRL 1]